MIINWYLAIASPIASVIAIIIYELIDPLGHRQRIKVLERKCVEDEQGVKQ